MKTNQIKSTDNILLFKFDYWSVYFNIIAKIVTFGHKYAMLYVCQMEIIHMYVRMWMTIVFLI
jgi:hypothetical protein